MKPTPPIRRGQIFVVGGGATLAPGQKIGWPSPPGQWISNLHVEQVDFNRDLFTRFIYGHGQRTFWEKNTSCPRRGPNDPIQNHDFACLDCDGTGFKYFEGFETRMMFQSATMEQQYRAEGRWDGNGVMVTGMPVARMHPFDRLTMMDAIDRFEQTVRRTPNSMIDKLKYPVIKSLPENFPAETSSGLLLATWVDRSNRQQNAVVDVDIRVNDDGTVEWLTSRRPDGGDVYSIAYCYHPRFVVLHLPHQWRNYFVGDERTAPIPPLGAAGGKPFEFPVQAYCKQDFLIRDQGKDAPQVVDKDPLTDDR